MEKMNLPAKLVSQTKGQALSDDCVTEIFHLINLIENDLEDYLVWRKN